MTSPTNPAEGGGLLAAVIAAGQRLSEAIARENSALRGRAREGLAALAEEKAAAAGLYQACLAELDQATHGYRALSAGEREALQQAAARLAHEAEENARLLRIALEASRRFMAAVADAVRALAPGATGYSPTGALGTAQRATARAPALSLDRSL